MYRTSFVELPRRPAEPGFVDDMVRQFADPYAFLRELVQNAIDAGATSIQVTIERTLEGRVTTATRDDGTGMTRATLEGPLLTLFSSSKDSDAAKIGKYGIGFVSVLACDPVHVDVATEYAGAAHRLRLFGDHSYELEPVAARGQAGTTVTLVHTMTAEDFGLHVDRSRQALQRFCRHARVPIHFEVTDFGADGRPATQSVNEPFGVSGVATVQAESGPDRVAVGIAAPDQPAFTGYYNRGLTLFESEASEPALLGLRVKIDSPRLAHTLSRDNVRQDRALRSLLSWAATLAHTTLRTRILTDLEAASRRADDPAEIARLLQLTALVALRCDDDPVVPLAEPFRGESVATLQVLRKHSGAAVVIAPMGSMAARVLGKTRPVVRFAELAPALRHHFAAVRNVAFEVEAAEALAEATPTDHELSRRVQALLRLVDHPVRRVFFASFAIRSARVFRVQSTRESCAVFDDGLGTPRGEPTLFFDAANPLVANARTAATRGHAAEAAHLLARLVLLEDGALPPSAVDALLEAAT